jgi:hypothetical protein
MLRAVGPAGCAPPSSRKATLLNWRAGPNEVLMADKGSLRLIVEAPACFVGEFRFPVLRRQYGQGGLFAVVEAGAGVRLHDAMAAAELAAGRFAEAELAE